jgi:hypothetical protein
MSSATEHSGKNRFKTRGKLIGALLIAIIIVASVLFLFSGYLGTAKTDNTQLGANNVGNSAPLTVSGTLQASYSPYVRGTNTYQWYVIATSNGLVSVLANYSTLTDDQVLTLQQKGHGGGIIVQVDSSTMQIVGIQQ